MRHRHAELILEYTKYYIENEEEFRNWQCNVGAGWVACIRPPWWHVDTLYRRVVVHPHYQTMLEYTEDCKYSNQAYLGWEFSSVVSDNGWVQLNEHPKWGLNSKYRRIK
jgi:hypothetical protein